MEMKKLTSKNELHSAGRLMVYGVAGVIGLVGANWVTTKTAANKYVAWVLLVGGIVSLVVATMVVKGTGKWEGPARLLLGLGGAVLILRGAGKLTNTSAKITTFSKGVI